MVNKRLGTFAILGASGAIALLIGLMAFAAPSAALSVRAVTVAGMLEKSALVVEGRVVASESRAVEGTRMIVTCVGIEIADVLKGHHQGGPLELCFLGGTLDGVTMHVAEMRYPVLGETGIYFVESTDRPQVHPLYGGSQGHFLTVRDPDSGEERVLTGNGKPVAGLAAAGIDPAPGLSNGIARGVQTAAAPGPAQAMSKQRFKQALRAMLGGPAQ